MSDIVGILKGDVGWGCSANSEEELACAGGSCKCERQIKQAAVYEIERMRALLSKAKDRLYDTGCWDEADEIVAALGEKE